MLGETDDVRPRIQAIKDPPSGNCTRCSGATGKLAPYYAKLDLPHAGVVIHLPICQRCVEQYLVMAWELRRKSEPAKSAKS